MTRLLTAILAALLLVLPAAGPDGAGAAERLGIVLLHGKDGTARAKSPIGRLAYTLGGSYRVVTPDMPWSRFKRFDRTLEASFEMIDEAVAKLKRGGATRIVVGGHSLGANVALAYAGRRTGLAGIVMIAPGHRPDAMRANDDALAAARTLIAEGRPDARVAIRDFNQGRRSERSLPAAVALSWFSPDGLAVMQNTAPDVSPGTPVLWIIGRQDPLLPWGRSLIYDRLPDHPKNAYVVVPGGHMATPTRGAERIGNWLRGL